MALKKKQKALEELKKELRFHLSIILRHARQTRRGTFLLATFKKSRYPSHYTRDAMAVSRFLLFLIQNKLFVEKAYPLLKGLANFTRSTQHKSGSWGQKYNEAGRDRSLYRQEDNVAHGVIILTNYMFARHALGKTLNNRKRTVTAIANACDFALKNLLKENRVFFSTTSCHESSLEKGYTLWTNMAFYRAFESVERLYSLSKYKSLLKPFNGFSAEFSKNLRKVFVRDGRYVARITDDNSTDRRPDVTLVAPYYFGFDTRSQALFRSASYAMRHLWDERFGLLLRYAPKENDLAYHNHAGHGPWLQYSAMFAQYFIESGHPILASRIMKLINAYRSKKGYLPEHITSAERFLEFMRREWKTGLDFKKEFDEEIMLKPVDFDRVVDEIINMRRSYYRTKRNLRVERERGFINFALPLSWSHAEYAYALALRAKKASVLK